MPKRVLKLITTLSAALLSLGVISLLLRAVEKVFAIQIVTQVPRWIHMLIIVLPSVVAGLVGFFQSELIAGWMKKRLKALEIALQKLPADQVVMGAIGLLLGLLVAYLLSTSYAGALPSTAEVAINALLYLIFGYLGIVIFAKRLQETQLNLVVQKFVGVRTKPAELGRNMLLDTSAIIDGRIFTVFESGFLDGTLVTYDFVVLELQSLADSADDIKRERGKRGLELLERAKAQGAVNLKSYGGELGQEDDVDAMLLKLAQKYESPLITCDYNLNKVASLVDVRVLNVNDLSKAIRQVLLPNQQVQVQLVRQGKSSNQAVGYLDDGTMVVVEDGAGHIGEKLNVKVLKTLQTSAGCMVFAQLN